MGESGKPDIVEFYNSSKAGVDTMDQLVRYYSTKRKTRRWPLCIFFNILDISCFNSMVIYLKKYPEYSQLHKNRCRRRYIMALVKEIVEKFGDEEELTEQNYPSKQVKLIKNS